MLAKWWKKIGFLILIIACLFNITIKIVKRLSFDENVKSTVTTKVNNVVTQVKDGIDGKENKKDKKSNSKSTSEND